MEIMEVFKELELFSKKISKELRKIKDVKYDENDKDEQFLFAHYSGIISDLEYAIESIDYINKPIVKTGVISTKSGKIYIDEMELIDHDCIEAFIYDGWEKIDIFKINGEFRTDFLKIDKNRKMVGRIRFSDEEAKERLGNIK